MTGNNRGRLKAAIFLGLASVLWMFGPKVPLDHYFAPTPVGTLSSPISSGSSREIAANLTTDLSAPTSKLADRSSRQAIARCFPQLNETTLEGTIDELRSSRSAKMTIELQNMHLKTSDGRELRLMIAPSESENFDGLEAQLFTVDREGLPVFEKWPLQIEARDVDAARKYFLDQGTLALSETTYLLRDDQKQVSGKLIYNHDQLAGVELHRDGRFLGCSKSVSSQQVACKCL